ncbi:MAG: alpha/beta family hydrolase [Candidatus Nanopelagicales bacterium]
MPTADRIEDIETTVGPAKAHFFTVKRGVPRATLILGHGAGGGIDAWDLQLLAGSLPRVGIDTVLVEQPWRVAGKKVAEAQGRVDAAFREVVTDLRRSGEALRRLVVGGRSTGARIACRTAAAVGADGVLCLAFPLHRPGRPTPTRVEELIQASEHCPITVIQGDRDSFGTPLEVASAVAEHNARALVVSVPWADHSFRIPKKATITTDEVGLVITEAARRTLLHRPEGRGPLLER